MKIALLWLLMAFPLISNADCADDMLIFHTKSYSIYIDQDCYVYTKISVVKDELKTYSFKKECSKSADNQVITCNKDGVTPLAGATYKKVPFGKNRYENEDQSMGESFYRYECVKGCNASTPKYSEVFYK